MELLLPDVYAEYSTPLAPSQEHNVTLQFLSSTFRGLHQLGS